MPEETFSGEHRSGALFSCAARRSEAGTSSPLQSGSSCSLTNVIHYECVWQCNKNGECLVLIQDTRCVLPFASIDLQIETFPSHKMMYKKGYEMSDRYVRGWGAQNALLNDYCCGSTVQCTESLYDDRTLLNTREAQYHEPLATFQIRRPLFICE